MENTEILLVEDNAGDAVLIRQILADACMPANLHIARDGEQAVTMLDSAQFRPDVIILDLNIPRISGIALLDRWKSLNIPVVVFSSTVNEREMSRVIELGAREFIQKPTDIEAFSDIICGIILRYGRSGGNMSKSRGGGNILEL
jgi:CheY-like chemotaxis protein